MKTRRKRQIELKQSAKYHVNQSKCSSCYVSTRLHSFFSLFLFLLFFFLLLNTFLSGIFLRHRELHYKKLKKIRWVKFMCTASAIIIALVVVSSFFCICCYCFVSASPFFLNLKTYFIFSSFIFISLFIMFFYLLSPVLLDHSVPFSYGKLRFWNARQLLLRHKYKVDSIQRPMLCAAVSILNYAQNDQLLMENIKYESKSKTFK